MSNCYNGYMVNNNNTIIKMNVLYPGAWTDASSVAAPGVAVQAGSELTASMQVR